MARTTLSKFIARSLLFLSVLLIAAVLYNHFLIDHSLERIREALDDASLGKVSAQADAYSFQDLLISEISEPDQTQTNLSQESLWPHESTQKSSAEFLLEDLLASYQKNRPWLLRALDSLNRFATEQYRQITQFFEFLSQLRTRQHKASPQLEGSQLSMLRQARELEFQWKFREASEIYEMFIKNYPSHENTDLIRLNLASVYLRSRELDAVEKTLDEVRLSLASAENVKIVSKLKRKLKEQRELSQKRSELANQAGGELNAQAWFQLGIYDLKLFDLPNAQSDFERVLKLRTDPETEKRTKWILNRIQLLLNDSQSSRRQMRELLEKLP